MAELPPDHSNYYRPGYNPAAGYSTGARIPGPPQVTVDSIGQACQMVFGDLGTWVVVSLLFILMSWAVSIPLTFLQNFLVYGSVFPMQAQPMDDQFLARYFSVVLPFSLVTQALTFPLQASLLEIAVRKQEGRPTGIQDLFVGFSKFPQLVLAGLMVGFFISIGMVLLLIPGFWLLGCFAFVPLIILRQNVSAWQAITISFNTLRSQGFMMFIVILLAALLNIAGFCALCVGLLFSIPIMYVAVASNYYNFFPPQFQQEPAGMGLAVPPPNP